MEYLVYGEGLDVDKVGGAGGLHQGPGLVLRGLTASLCFGLLKGFQSIENIQGESKKSVISNQLEKPTGPYLTLSDLTGPYWALLGLTGPYWALLAYLLNLYTH